VAPRSGAGAPHGLRDVAVFAPPRADGTGAPCSKGIRRGLRDARRDVVLMWQGGGVAAAREAFLHRTLHRLYRRRKFLVLEHPLLDGGESLLVEGVEIRALEDRDWESLEKAVTTRSVERFRRRLARGRTCLVAWRGGRPIGYSWISERIEPEIEELAIALPNEVVYCWDLYVIHDERSSGVGSALANARLEHARQLGFRRAWRIVSPANAPAIRTSEKWSPGVRVIGDVTVVKLLGRMRARYELREA
jgi:GNAT superfamily N-acetyltransferase